MDFIMKKSLKYQLCALSLCIFIFSINSFAVKNSMFNLTEQIFILTLQSTNYNLQTFWKSVQSTPSKFEILEKNLIKYPAIISDFYNIIIENRKFYIIDKLNLTKMKKMLVGGKLSEQDYLLEFSHRKQHVKDELPIWQIYAIDEAITAIINCLEVITLHAGCVIINNKKIREIGGDFEKDIIEVLQKKYPEFSH